MAASCAAPFMDSDASLAFCEMVCECKHIKTRQFRGLLGKPRERCVSNAARASPMPCALSPTCAEPLCVDCLACSALRPAACAACAGQGGASEQSVSGSGGLPRSRPFARAWGRHTRRELPRALRRCSHAPSRRPMRPKCAARREPTCCHAAHLKGSGHARRPASPWPARPGWKGPTCSSAVCEERGKEGKGAESESKWTASSARDQSVGISRVSSQAESAMPPSQRVCPSHRVSRVTPRPPSSWGRGRARRLQSSCSTARRWRARRCGLPGSPGAGCRRRWAWRCLPERPPAARAF